MKVSDALLNLLDDIVANLITASSLESLSFDSSCLEREDSVSVVLHAHNAPAALGCGVECLVELADVCFAARGAVFKPSAPRLR